MPSELPLPKPVQILLSIAFEELEAPLERLMVGDGTITDPATGRSTTYWAFFGGQRFGRADQRPWPAKTTRDPSNCRHSCQTSGPA